MYIFHLIIVIANTRLDMTTVNDFLKNKITKDNDIFTDDIYHLMIQLSWRNIYKKI